MIKAVLCDMDGTLVDSNALHAEAWQRSLEHFGIQVSFQAALSQIGKGGDQIIPTFVDEKDLPRLQEPLKKYRSELFHKEYFGRMKGIPGARDLLLKMKQAGLRIAVATSAEKSDIEKLKEIAGISDLVERETSSDDAEQSKPEPDIFQAALDRLKIKPDEALALGDTPWDVQAAEKAGVKTIAVTSGGWPAEELYQAGAIEVYSDVRELTERFEESVLGGRKVAV